jgi:hypothetical protein
MIASLTIAAASVLASYDCSVGSPTAVFNVDGKRTTTQLQLPASKWQFSVKFVDDDGYWAEVSWPTDPIQAQGKFPALPIANGSYAFAALSQGPCLFTEAMCMSQFTVVDTGKADAQVVITPAALSLNQDKTHSAMPVVITGTCSRKTAA